MIDLTGHFLLFTTLALVAFAGPLILGKLVRPRLPTPEKDAIYECGEPTIGSSYIQFDLRFYAVALLFIVFDVEVVFFYPWAMIYGNSMQLADTRLSEVARTEISGKLLNTPAAELSASNVIGAETALSLGTLAFFDLLVFFAVLLLGFAYVWKRGDLDWVRAVAKPPRVASTSADPELLETSVSKGEPQPEPVGS